MQNGGANSKTERMTCLANAIELRNITKRFGQVVANKSISLELHKGEILSLLGENGSGKTTLMNMLSGIYYPDEGQIFVDGKEVEIRSPKDAFDLHIGMIHQHFKLVDVFTAAENIILGLPGDKGKMDKNAVAKAVREIADRYGFDIDPNQKIYEMSVSQKQTVEIVKVLYRGADILILDEPTAVLTPQETEKLFTVMRNMKKDGKAIIIITHKLHEVLAVSDRVAVLRKGEYIGDTDTATASQQSLTDMMVGRAVSLNIDRPLNENQTERLRVEHLTVKNKEGVKMLDDARFSVLRASPVPARRNCLSPFPACRSWRTAAKLHTSSPTGPNVCSTAWTRSISSARASCCPSSPRTGSAWALSAA